MYDLDSSPWRSLIDRQGDCWIWEGRITPSGRPPTLAYQGKHVSRRAYMRAKSGLPLRPGQPLLSICHNVLCVSPTCSGYADEEAMIRARIAKYLAPADSNGCQLWNGAKDSPGYPVMSKPSSWKTKQVIRNQLLLGGKDLPRSLQVSHLCERKDCCAPEHLEPATGSMNKTFEGLQRNPETRMSIDKAREWHREQLRQELGNH
jgi:hypothetical protein